jgi:teichoic acid transport system ATP-binding protein
MAATDAPAIVVRDVHVRYRVYVDQRLSARELLARRLRGRETVEVHALRGVSFDIHVGEAVGVLGANGSGKSTLLRTIAGLQSKDSGTVLVRSEPHLLGVSAALKPQLSGYRNVMLGGLAMGMTEDEVRDQIPEVERFSGLADAMSRPMATYSSGMRARLAFSIATLTSPDILLLDEALAVGDRDFRARSLERVNEIRDAAGAVVLVTHNLGEIRQTCSRAIWLEEGQIVADGDAEDVIEMYESANPDDLFVKRERILRRHWRREQTSSPAQATN